MTIIGGVDIGDRVGPHFDNGFGPFGVGFAPEVETKYNARKVAKDLADYKAIPSPDDGRPLAPGSFLKLDR